MRLPSGVVDQVVYFVAVDATDFSTREPGLSSFTVYRSRNGSTPTAMGTPTIVEVDATNMPGVYSLLLDEDTTLDSGDVSQEMAFHITHAGMLPVTRTVEIFEPPPTAAEVNAQVDIALSDYDAATNTEVISYFAALNDLSSADVNAAVDTALADYDGPTSAELTAAIGGLNDISSAEVNAQVDAALIDYDAVTPADLTAALSGLNDLSAADVNAEVDTALSDYDGPTNAELTLAINSLNDPTASDIADAVWTEQTSDHSGVSGSTAESLNAAGAAGDPWTTVLPGSYTGSQAGNILAGVLEDTGTTLPAQISGISAGSGLDAAGVRAAIGLSSANLDTQLATIDSNIDAVVVDTSTTLSGQISGVSSQISSLNDLNQAEIRSAIGMGSANFDTQISTIDGVVDAILVDTDSTIPGIVASLNNIDAAGVRSAVGLASANLDTQLSALPTSAAPTALENADALLNRDMSAVTVTNARSPINALRFLRNRYAVVGTTLSVYEEDDATPAWTAEVTADAAADPITGSDPA